MPGKVSRRRAQLPQQLGEVPPPQLDDGQPDLFVVGLHLLGDLDPVLERARVGRQRAAELHAPLHIVVFRVHAGKMGHDLGDVPQRPRRRFRRLFGGRVLEVFLRGAERAHPVAEALVRTASVPGTGGRTG